MCYCGERDGIEESLTGCIVRIRGSHEGRVAADLSLHALHGGSGGEGFKGILREAAK